MKTFTIALLLLLSLSITRADDYFDTEEVHDPSTLETTVIQDWHPNAKDPAIQQKLIEITVCEWWPGQKVRLPVTLNIPTGATAIENVIVANSSLALKPATPNGVELDLLKNHGVGVVLIGMSTIDAMKPVGELHLGMREHLLATDNTRYTPAWIWGMSQMRALTAAEAESQIFKPNKVITTGGSKRGVAAAAAGIHDDRFTAIMPVVAPILGNPGGSYVTGLDDPEIVAANEQYLTDIAAGKLPLNPSVKEALDERAQRRDDSRISLQQVTDAEWSHAQIDSITDRAWDVCRIVDFLPALEKRGLEYFYFVGTNDSVSPALLALGKTLPHFPLYIAPGGQHGGPATAGFTVRTPLIPEASENFKTFCLSHFFDARPLPSTPTINHLLLADGKHLEVVTTFTDDTEPQTNTLSWSINRHRPYTLAFEYDSWQSTEMEKIADFTYRAIIEIPADANTVDFLSNHRHVKSELPFNVSSAYQRHTVPAK